MITFACSACAKKLSLKETLAGKKVKCPGCGQVMVAPALAAAPPSNPDQHTWSQEPGPKSASPDRPAPAAAENGPTVSPLSQLEATQDAKSPERGHDSSLTAFLSPPQADDELGRLGKYRILKVLGHGGMGVVFQAEDSLLERQVAIKAMLPTLSASASAGQRFLREAKAMAAVKHDHIVTIYQVDEERGVPFLAMEFLQGEPLDRRLGRDKKLAVPEVLRIGREIAAGLDAAHTTGLIHRDIKPSNIWLEDRRGTLSPGGRGQGEGTRVKILDFGLARATAQAPGLTQQGAIVGTPAYMAPEQARALRWTPAAICSAWA